MDDESDIDVFAEEDGKDSSDHEENVNMNDSKRELYKEPDDQTTSRGIIAYNIQPISKQGNPRNIVTHAAKVIPKSTEQETKLRLFSKYKNFIKHFYILKQKSKGSAQNTLTITNNKCQHLPHGRTKSRHCRNVESWQWQR